MRMDTVVTFLGSLFLRYGKGAFPIVILAAYSLAAPNERIFGSEHLENVVDIVALAVVLLGLTVRAVAAGSNVHGRSADAEGFASGGVYAVVRNPLYLGSLFVCFGIFLMHGSLSVVLLGTAACVLIFAAMARVEEDRLRTRLGEAYSAYCAKVPRWVPDFANLSSARSGIDFSVRRALARDWLMIAATAAALAFTEVHELLPPALAASSQTFIIGLAASLAIGASLAIAFRTAAADIGGRSRARSTTHSLGFAGPKTRGIRVDGRAGRSIAWRTC